MWWAIAVAFGQEPGPLIVGTHPVPPFVVHQPDGSWGGLSIDLWKHIAEEQGLAYEIREYPVPELLENRDGAIDVAVSLNINERSEQAYDMTHAFLSTGLAIAVRSEGATLGSALRRVHPLTLVGAAAVTLVALTGAGVLIWAAERRKNADEFGGRRGPVLGVLWALETALGFRKPVQRTMFGRVVGIVWAAFGVAILTTLTAQLSSLLTLNQLETSVSGPEDLPRVRVGTVEPSAGFRYCERRALRCASYPDAEAALTGLARREVDAVLYEGPILQYWVHQRPGDALQVLPGTFDNHGYGLGLKTGSPLRETVDRSLLRYVATEDFTSMLARQLGP